MSIEIMARRLMRFGGTCVFLFACILSNPVWAEESALENAKSLLGLLDATEMGHDPGVSPDSLSERLGQTEKALARFLQENPDNVDALIISARLDRFSILMKPIIFSPGEVLPDQSAAYLPIHGKLDKALALQPNNAEAHFWKARIYGIRHPVIRQGTFYMEAASLEKAVQFAQKAVEFEPTNIAYREALAFYLIQSNKSDQALEVMRTVANGQHPIFVLLKDLEPVPIPTTAVSSAVDSENIAQMALEGGMIHDYPQLRVHVYVVPMSRAKLQDFYANYWEGFELFKADRDTPDSVQQLLLRKGNTLQPAKTASEIPEEPSTGILLMVMEDSRKLLVEDLERHAATTGDLKKTPSEIDRFCRLIVINLHQVND